MQSELDATRQSNLPKDWPLRVRGDGSENLPSNGREARSVVLSIFSYERMYNLTDLMKALRLAAAISSIRLDFKLNSIVSGRGRQKFIVDYMPERYLEP